MTMTLFESFGMPCSMQPKLSLERCPTSSCSTRSCHCSVLLQMRKWHKHLGLPTVLTIKSSTTSWCLDSLDLVRNCYHIFTKPVGFITLGEYCYLFISKSSLAHRHHLRNIDKLASATDTEMLNYLRNFPFLSACSDFQAFHNFCTSSPVPEINGEGFENRLQIIIMLSLIIAWWNHKLIHKWIIPSINWSVTKMPRNHWDLVPNDTNTMEGSHTDDNRIRGINHSPVDTILM